MELIVEHVSHAFGSLQVLDDVSFAVASGEVLAIVGPSGCGKSTLLSILGGLLQPSAGVAEWRGALPAGSLNPLTFVFQDFALLPATSAQPLLDAGDAELLGWVGDETPWQLGAVFAGTATNARHDQVARFLAGYRGGTRDFHDRLLAVRRDGKVLLDDRTRPFLEIIAKYTNLPVEQVVGNCAYVDPDGRLDVKNVGNQIEWLQVQGFVDKGFSVDAILAKEYVKPD